MKFLVFLSCALAFASAGYPYYYANNYAPAIGPKGVPIDTYEVQAAKANHFAAHAAARHGGYLNIAHYGVVPSVTADGRPIDTPEVQLAKAAHFIAYNQAAIRNSLPHAAGIIDGPVETPEVQIAKAKHFAAHAEAKARAGGHYRKRRAAGYYPQQLPAIGPNGVPLDTPEVEAAKAKHFALLSQRNSQPQHYNGPQYQPQQYQPQQYQPQQYQPQPYQGQPWHGPYHIPQITQNGVPTETPEVQARKSEHLSALQNAGGLYRG